MRTKPAILAFFALATIAMQGLFTSCSSDEPLGTEKQEGLQTLKINLKPADTRAAAYTDPASITPNPEDKINSVTIGIFDKTTGNVKTIQDAANAAAPEITTSQLADGDDILVAVNAPAGTFNGALTESDFEKKTLAINDALPVSGSVTVDPAKLPMFGTGSIALKSGSSTAYEATVPVSHMVAKVTLTSLKVAFDPNGAYKDATFTPLEVFMYNVPEKLEFNPADAYTYIYADGSYYNGEVGKSSVKDYLGTGTDLASLSGKVLKGDVNATATNSWGTNLLYFYTMPNNSASPTQLVIKGTFDPDGKGTNTGTVYYPVNINYNSDDGSPADLSGGGKDGTAKHVYPNKNYVIAVIIKGKGADSPTTSLDPQTVTATISVNSFVDATQSNTFN
ncbi:hypothetical protein prwr041_03480 [Prevotella herbatica]|uniref:Major fimbrial subunit protein N-terminal domain-containing protein n=1 Tax=Prevotella herbatica TaxID=2801997 RepID=A0ABM7NVK3_9BACT|nr:hypothetical protein [Prevotella herbatica]BCS84455.1 hypothetical protein prwr041_03480 [Prevotella herbatica]